MISGWGAVSGYGVGRAALEAIFRECGAPRAAALVEAHSLYSEPLPPGGVHAALEFNVRALLGRKGTSFLDRRSALAMVACGEALESSGLGVDDGNRHRVGIALGTTCGSFKSMSDFNLQTHIERKPYLVDPAQFPNTVLNCAAGQTAIRFGLKGVNATLAGGPLAFLTTLAYAQNALRRGYGDVIITGAVEELTPHNAWSTHLCRNHRPEVPPGEGAAMFVLESEEGAAAAGRRPIARIESVVIAFCPGGQRGGRLRKSLAECVSRAIAAAHVEAAAIQLVATCACDPEASQDNDSPIEAAALADALGGREYELIDVTSLLGDCQAATGALQMAALLCRGAAAVDRLTPLALLTGWTHDGGVGAAVVRVNDHGRTHLQ